MRGRQDRDLVLDLRLERAGDQALGKGTAHHRIDDADTASLCDQLARGREELRLRNDIPARAVFGKGGRKVLVDRIAAKQGDERDSVESSGVICLSFADANAALAAATQVGSDTLITVNASTTILLKNVALANLHDADFHIVWCAKIPFVALGCRRADYNDARLHSQLGWRTPSEFAITCHPRRDLVLRQCRALHTSCATVVRP